MSKKTEIPNLEIHWIDINLINEAEYNPRKITPKKKKELRESMEKFGLRDPLKINMNPDRLHVLISGHQRLKIAKELDFEKVPVTYEYLTLEEEQEMNLRWNKNGGEFDMDLVLGMGDRQMLLEIGFSASELPKLLTDFEEKFNEIDVSTPVYPIVPKFNEKYDFVMILTTTEMDYNWLKNVLELTQAIDYKSTSIGECRVITVQQFQKLHKEWKSKS